MKSFLTHLGSNKGDYSLQATFLVAWRIVFYESSSILIHISVNYVRCDPFESNSALVQQIAWHRMGPKWLPGPMMAKSPMYICVTRSSEPAHSIHCFCQCYFRKYECWPSRDSICCWILRKTMLTPTEHAEAVPYIATALGNIFETSVNNL